MHRSELVSGQNFNFFPVFVILLLLIASVFCVGASFATSAAAGLPSWESKGAYFVYQASGSIGGQWFPPADHVGYGSWDNGTVNITNEGKGEFSVNSSDYKISMYKGLTYNVTASVVANWIFGQQGNATEWPANEMPTLTWLLDPAQLYDLNGGYAVGLTSYNPWRLQSNASYSVWKGTFEFSSGLTVPVDIVSGEYWVVGNNTQSPALYSQLAYYS